MWRLGSKFVNVLSMTFVGNLAPGKFIEPRDASPTAYTWRIDLGAFYAIQQIVIPRRPDLGLINNIEEHLINSHSFSSLSLVLTTFSNFQVTRSHLFSMFQPSSIPRPTLYIFNSLFLLSPFSFLLIVQYHFLSFSILTLFQVFYEVHK